MSQPAASPEPSSTLPDLAVFARPRLRAEVPLLWRSQSSIQIGDDIVLERITRSQVAWMTSLDGLQSPAVIEDSLTIAEHDARRLVRALLAAGALEDAARIPERMRWVAPSEREGVASRFGALLDEHRDLNTALRLSDARDHGRIGIVGEGPLAADVAEAISAAGLTRDDLHATVLVLADAPHPDVTARVDRPELDRAHVHLGVRGRRAVVGPLVVPGRTSCLRCAHLHRRDADPSWPLLAVQWSQAAGATRTPPYDPALARLAAQHAALLVRRMIDGGHEEEWANHCLDMVLPQAIPVRRERPPHPLCGCRWASD